MPHTNWDARVTEEMSVEPLTVRADNELKRVAELLSTRHVSGLPVVNGDGRAVGIISQTDLIRFMLERGSLEGRVQDAMTDLALSLSETTSVRRAAAIMAIEGIHRLPVLSQDGRVLGITTSMDVVRWVARNEGLLPSEDVSDD